MNTINNFYVLSKAFFTASNLAESLPRSSPFFFPPPEIRIMFTISFPLRHIRLRFIIGYTLNVKQLLLIKVISIDCKQCNGYIDYNFTNDSIRYSVSILSSQRFTCCLQITPYIYLFLIFSCFLNYFIFCPQLF